MCVHKEVTAGIRALKSNKASDADGLTAEFLRLAENEWTELLVVSSGEGLRKTLPGVTSVAEATQIYNKWSTPKQRSKLRQKHGYAMLAIRV